MDEIAALANEIKRGKVARARAAGIEEKLLDCPRLFATACEAARARISSVCVISHTRPSGAASSVSQSTERQ
jgi:hypothetical protein